MRGVCPVCEQLVEITPTGRRIAPGWTATFWCVAVHDRDPQVDDVLQVYRGMILVTFACGGSGRLI